MSRPPRLARDNYVGFRPYFLTICTYQRLCVFSDAEEVAQARLHFLQQATRELVELTVYCFMPDHMHALLMGLREDADIDRFVRRAKQHSGFHFSRRRRHRLWQEGYYDRALRKDEAVSDVVRYIINDPVRPGIVSSPEKYPAWGSSV